MNYVLDLGVIYDNYVPLLVATGKTLTITFLSCIMGTLFALPIVFLLCSRITLLRSLSTAFVVIVRGVPLMVSLIFTYYFLPGFLGFHVAPSLVAIAVFSIYLSSFVADVLRGNAGAIPRDIIDQYLCLGMTPNQVNLTIVVPDMIRRSFPAIWNLYITLLKYSTMASVITVDELFRTGDLIVIGKYKPIEIYGAIALIFILIVLCMSSLGRYLEGTNLLRVEPRRTT